MKKKGWKQMSSDGELSINGSFSYSVPGVVSKNRNRISAKVDIQYSNGKIYIDVETELENTEEHL